MIWSMITKFYSPRVLESLNEQFTSFWAHADHILSKIETIKECHAIKNKVKNRALGKVKKWDIVNDK